MDDNRTALRSGGFLLSAARGSVVENQRRRRLRIVTVRAESSQLARSGLGFFVTTDAVDAERFESEFDS
jgi:hypothetical protein